MKVIKIDEEGNRSISYTIVTWEKRKGYQRVHSLVMLEIPIVESLEEIQFIHVGASCLC